jgi:hypothetical protein
MSREDIGRGYAGDASPNNKDIFARFVYHSWFTIFSYTGAGRNFPSPTIQEKGTGNAIVRFPRSIPLQIIFAAFSGDIKKGM